MKILLAGCVIVDDYGRVLLLHRSTDDYSHWELPGGKIEQDESPEDAAVREAREELGVDVRLLKNLGEVEFEDDEREFHFTWFQAEVAQGDPKVCEPETFDDLDYFELEDMLSLALSPNMQLLLPQLASGEVALDR